MTPYLPRNVSGRAFCRFELRHNASKHLSLTPNLSMIEGSYFYTIQFPMTKLQGLIPAAGKGVRARPYTHSIHKGMLDIHGAPNIQRIVAIMRDQLDIEEIVIVIGYLGETIQAFFGDGANFGVKIRYVKNEDLDKGLAWSIALAQHEITAEHFCIMLCDECYISSNHNEILNYNYTDYTVTCCGLPVDDNRLIQRNFAVYLDEQQNIKSLEEKPKVVSSRILGTGTFVCARSIFAHLTMLFELNSEDGVEFVTALNELHQAQSTLGFFEIEGTYVNINDRDSLHLAKYHERKRCFEQSAAGLLIYSEGHEANINFTIARYAELGFFETISVVLPSDNTIEDKVLAHGAVPIVCPPQCTQYGEKLRHAMNLASEDIIILTEADYSFSSRDVDKLLTYLPEADMVIGSRTTRQLIEQGSNMDGLVRLAHHALGLLVEVLWWNRQGRFTDVGCTFRAIWKSSWENIKDDLVSDGPEFSAEMMIELMRQHQRVIEIPVSYFNQSQSTKKQDQTASIFFRFIKLILTRRLSGQVENSSRKGQLQKSVNADS
jgi:dTDP-glucose pyrophosphorylase